ncbi:hypothetical protein BSKO_05982 [Bryopsis sp. KO-2023]|nr:hypothetical protein BSKO_05982 [Bryopsis sp. KO-2023]
MADFLPASLQGSFGFRSTPQPTSCHLSCPVSSPDCFPLPGAPVSHWYRLFVGWVPRQYKEADLQPIFDKCGEVKDIIILKDKVSGQPKGCAFVSYATEAEAKKAIAELDRKIQLSGASSPMEVRFARSHQYIQAGTGPQDNRQLFFSRAPTSASEDDFKAAFSKYGKVIEINVFTDRKSCMSKGCGFVTMASRHEAFAAIENMNDQYVLQGSTSTLAVKWADPDLQSKKKKAVEEANADKRLNIPPTKETVSSPFPSADRWLSRDSMDNEVIAKILDAQLQKKRREEQLAATMREAQQSRNSGGGICRMPGTNALYSVPPGATLVAAQPHAVRRLDYTHDVPPLGCQSDAIKLFVGNIPKTYTAENLRPLFDQIGTVIELVVVRDKLTDESKGSAFVWYQTRCEAERAIAELHLRHILHDPTGEQDRPLVVRRANPKVPPVLLQAAAVMPQTSPTAPAPVHSFQQQSVMPPMMDSSLDFPAHLQGSFMPESLSMEPNPSSSISRMSSDFNSLSLLPFTTRKVLADPEPVLSKAPVTVGGLDLNVQSLLGTQSLDNVDPGLSSPFDFLSPAEAFPSPAGSNSSTSPTSGFQMSSVNPPSMPLQQNLCMGQMTLALPISPQQGSVIGANLHNIQVTSGALIQLAPGANNSYVVMLSGNESQVNTAKAIVQDLISQS